MAISRNDRAKQFLPFDALKGFKEALREKEIEYVEKRELSEELLEELSKKIREIEKSDNVRIIYYINKQYKEIIGRVQEINIINSKITLYENTKINFNDIIEIERI